METMIESSMKTGRVQSMAQLRAAHEKFFDRRTCRFFGDVSYKLMTARKTGQRFLVRYSSAWSDMFSGVKTYRYFINPIGSAPDFYIYPMVEDEHRTPRAFADLDDVKDFLADVTTPLVEK